MTADQKIINVEAQIRAILRGATNCLNCPYCGDQNFPAPEGEPESPMCCPDMAQTVNAVTDKLQSNELLDAADRISQNAAKMVNLN